MPLLIGADNEETATLLLGATCLVEKDPRVYLSPPRCRDMQEALAGFDSALGYSAVALWV